MKFTTRSSAAAATLMLLATAGFALAQGPGGPGGGPRDPEAMAARQLTTMTERLKLTDEQQTKLKPILLENAKQMVEMFKKFTPGEPPSEEMRAEMQKSRQAQNKKVDAVLTDTQKKEYQKMLSERRGPGGQGRGPGGPPPQN
jgi:periplasmic protein CpxP/Spy